MKTLLMMLMTPAFLFAADPPKEDANKTELKKLEGDWRLEAFEVTGSKIEFPKIKGTGGEQPASDAVIRIKGDEWTELPIKGTFLSRKPSAAKLKIDSTKKPKLIDFRYVDGDYKGRTTLAIYELDGDNLKINQPNVAINNASRPTSFATEGKFRIAKGKSDATEAVLFLKRVRPEVPEK